MKRADVIRHVVSALPDDALMMTATGMISREAFAAGDRDRHLYLIGSMGLVSSVGLGVALASPERLVVVLDGDGSLLMNLGTLVMVGEQAPSNFLHVVLDNEAYESTGGQPSSSRHVDLAELARSSGYRRVCVVDDAASWEQQQTSLWDIAGPTFCLVKVGPEGVPGIDRVNVPPDQLASRFRGELQTT